MLLTISTTYFPATDLGYLLHKHPQKVQSFPLAFGNAHVFYPRADEDCCTAALLLEVDPVGLVRGKGREPTLDQYVNDRPYAASSMLAVAIAQVFRSALSGACKEKPDLALTAIPLVASIPAIACRGGSELLRTLFEPLGYTVNAATHPLDTAFADWGDSTVVSVELSATKPLHELLSHLYVLIPVLDNEKHYWVGDDEVDKLMRHGEGWLATHPQRELIATRYLKYQRSLADDVIKQLREQDGEGPDEIDADLPEDPREEAGERKLSLHQQRHGVVLSVLQAKAARSVVDLGCGEGKLIRDLIKHPTFERILGMDVSHRILSIAAERLRLDRLPPTVRKRLDLVHGSLMYRDARLEGFDAAVLCEVIEHLDEPRLAALERVVFGAARPGIVIVTTPNSEYNVMWETLAADSMRHRDHRFEWTRDQFKAWAAGVCSRHGYTCEFRGVGDVGVTPEGRDVGTPSQMGVFSRAS
jgi:3' terminal RNA ribose 2'-O-methyltransferase Hen1